MAYSWAGSLPLSWLIWYQLPPIDVSLVWGIFGLALFMTGEWKSWSFLRLQAYVALGCSFAHVFYANFNVLSAPGAARPEVFTVIPLVGIYFFIYWELHAKKAQGTALESRIRIDDLVACLGTATLAALGRFELPAESVAIGYAVLVIATLLAARFTRLQVFIYQALALLGMAAFRLSMNNFYHLREAFGSNLSAAVWTIGVLATRGFHLPFHPQKRGARIHGAALGGAAGETLRAAHVFRPVRVDGGTACLESGSGHDHAGVGCGSSHSFCACFVGQGTQLPARRTRPSALVRGKDHSVGRVATQ